MIRVRLPHHLRTLAGVGADWTRHRTWRRVVMAFIGFGALVNFIVIGSGALTGDIRIFVALDALRLDHEPVIGHHGPSYLFPDEMPDLAGATRITRSTLPLLPCGGSLRIHRRQNRYVGRFLSDHSPELLRRVPRAIGARRGV